LETVTTEDSSEEITTEEGTTEESEGALKLDAVEATTNEAIDTSPEEIVTEATFITSGSPIEVVTDEALITSESPVETLPEETVTDEVLTDSESPVETSPDESLVTSESPVETSPEETLTTSESPLETLPEETVTEILATSESPIETSPEEIVTDETLITSASPVETSPEETVTEDNAVSSESPIESLPEEVVGTTEAVIASTEKETASTEDTPTTRKPSKDFCLHKGMIIQNLADVPSKDPCELCQCVDGEIVCATQECQGPPKPGCIEVQEEGSCCPKYECDDTTTPAAEAIIKTTQNSAEIDDDDEEIQDDDIGYEYEESEEGVEDKDDYEEEEDNEIQVGSAFVVDSSKKEDKVDEETEEEITETQKPVEEATTMKATDKPTTTPSITSPKPVSTTQLTSLLTTTLAQEGIQTTVTPAPLFGTESGDVFEPEEDYPYVDIDSIGPGACLFENKIYVSAQQIPRDNPCDFCFCFRGDIICLQQSCPPPIPGCTEEIISGFCCPRYECPVKMSVHNVTKHVQHEAELPSIASWFPWADTTNETVDETYSEEVSGCEVQGNFYEAGSIVEASSGPCLQCRCDYNEKLDCEPQDCETQPLVKRMLENLR